MKAWVVLLSPIGDESGLQMWLVHQTICQSDGIGIGPFQFLEKAAQWSNRSPETVIGENHLLRFQWNRGICSALSASCRSQQPGIAAHHDATGDVASAAAVPADRTGLELQRSESHHRSGCRPGSDRSDPGAFPSASNWAISSRGRRDRVGSAVATRSVLHPRQLDRGRRRSKRSCNGWCGAR